jgi:hypothetical protein
VNKRNRYALNVLAALLIGMSAILGGATTLHAGSVATAIYTIATNVTNTGSTDQDYIQVAFSLSAASLIDGNFIEADALNALIHKGTTDVPGMPSSNRIQVEGAVVQDGDSFTEKTSESQSTALNDIPLLPATAAVDDAFYFGCDNPCRIVTIDIDTAGVGTWTLTWEYWNGSSFKALSNVDDRTSGFTALGRNTASWDMPSDWATNTVTGSAVTSYWGRARVSAFTSETTQPLGTRTFYENGQWWTWVEDLDVGLQEQLTLHFGGATDLQTSHQTFPGAAGIITGDAATVEVSGSYSIGLIGRFDFSAAGASTRVINKTGAISVTVSGSAATPVIGTTITGGATVSGDLTGITMPDTGEQTIIIAADGVNAATFFGATAGGMVSYPVQGIVDNGNNYTWASNGGIDYFNNARLDTAAATVFDFDTTFSDFDTGTQTSTQAYTGGLGLDNQ